MDVAIKFHAKLKKMLKKLKHLGIIQTFKLEINFCQVDENLKRNLVEVDTVLKKCLRKIINKPRKAEIRNIISELVRKKNLSDIIIAQEPIQGDLLEQKSFYIKHTSNDIAALALTFQCSFCKEIFTSKKNFIIHKKKVHKTSEKYLCDKCGKLFHNFQQWQEHLKKYSGPFPLPIAIENFTSDVQNELLIFDNCDINMLPENSFQNAVPSQNLSIQTEDEKALQNSIQENNLNCLPQKREKKFTCSCGKDFHILKTLRKHERLKHSGRIVKYDCASCGKSFIEKGKLNRHMLSHKDSQYSCSFCMKQFSRSDTLKRHMTLFHNTPQEFLCSYCKKKFKLKYNRDIHEENIHKNVNCQVQCQHCGRKFKNKITLKSHIKTFHSENKLSCTACCKSFSRKSYYRSHMKTKHFGTVPCQKSLESVKCDGMTQK